MPSFLTQCPHCLTSFRVTDRQLDAAEGRVRCGACLGIFSAEANRIIVKPTPDEIAAAEARELAELEDDDELDALDEAEDDEALDESESNELDEDEYEDEAEEDEVEEDQEDDGTDDFYDEEDDEPVTAGSPDDANDTLDLLDSRDFDIPLGDLNLEEEEEDEDEHALDDSEQDASTEDTEEEDDAETSEDDASAGYDDDPEDEELELDGDESAEESATGITARETRLIDIVYEEYTDEEAEPADEAEPEPEPSEEFEPEFIFEEDVEEFEDEDIDAADEYEDEDEDIDDEDLPAEQVEAEEIIYEEYVLPDATDELSLTGDEDQDEDEDEDEKEEPAFISPRYANQRTSTDKAALRNYLADIEDDEALDPLDDDALADLDEPVLLEAAPRRSRLAVVALLLANLALVAVLAWQYADEHIEQLGRSASFAPLMPYACRVLDCPEPQRAQPDLFVSEQVLVRSHPRFAQALEVNLVFRNDAPEAQPFPALELGFHDPGNRMVANRLFQPAEYLPPELRTSEMPAQSSIQVTLELVDPDSDAVNYTLAFHAP